jgi:hypothetical protein
MLVHNKKLQLHACEFRNISMHSFKGTVEMIVRGKDPTRWREYLEDDSLMNDPDVTTYGFTNPHIGIANHPIWNNGYGASVPISELRRAAENGCKCCAIVLDGLYAYKPLPFELLEETSVSWAEDWRGCRALEVRLRTPNGDIALELQFYVHGGQYRLQGSGEYSC